MKNLLCVLPLLLVTPSCSTLGEILDVPAAVVSDTGAALDTLTPGEEAITKTVGDTATTGVTLVTGNTALGVAAGSLATLLTGWFLRKRKQATA